MKKILLSAAAFSLLVGSAFAQFSIQKVVFEEGTGAWCQYCADGAAIADVMDNNFPDALMIGVHNGDAMTIPDGDTINDFYVAGYPQPTFNRSGAAISRGAWNSTMSGMLQGSSAVTVSFDSVDYNMTTRVLTVDVRAMFTGIENGDLRINLAITEDEVTGTGSGYNQVNADNNTPGHVYQGAGNPIVGFKHSHVLRAYLGGPWGNAGDIPATTNFGTVGTHRYTYTIPANYDDTKIQLVAFVSRHNGPGITERRILNGEEFNLSTLTVGRTEMNAASETMTINGNPLVERAKIVFTTETAGNYKLEVLNMLGQQVANLGEAFVDKGIHTMVWNGQNNAGFAVENGMYLVRLLSENGQALSKRILVAR